MDGSSLRGALYPVFLNLKNSFMKYFLFFLGVGVTVVSILGFGFMIGHETKNTQEYQIRLELDSAYIYDGSRLVGVTPHGNDGIDSVLLLDNR